MSGKEYILTHSSLAILAKAASLLHNYDKKS